MDEDDKEKVPICLSRWLDDEKFTLFCSEMPRELLSCNSMPRTE